MANIKKFSVVKEIGPVESYFYQVEPTEEENLIPVENLQKVFCIKLSEETSTVSNKNFFVIKLSDVFEHS